MFAVHLFIMCLITIFSLGMLHKIHLLYFNTNSIMYSILCSLFNKVSSWCTQLMLLWQIKLLIMVYKGSSVYRICLDDRVKFIKLFKLLSKNICPAVCNSLALQYTAQRCCVYSSIQYMKTSLFYKWKQGVPFYFLISMSIYSSVNQSNLVLVAVIFAMFYTALKKMYQKIHLSPTRTHSVLLRLICWDFPAYLGIYASMKKAKKLDS